jgi:hypothetical protein
MNFSAFERDSADRKKLGAQKNEVFDHLGGVRPSTESKFAASPEIDRLSRDKLSIAAIQTAHFWAAYAGSQA